MLVSELTDLDAVAKVLRAGDNNRCVAKFLLDIKSNYYLLLLQAIRISGDVSQYSELKWCVNCADIKCN